MKAIAYIVVFVIYSYISVSILKVKNNAWVWVIVSLFFWSPVILDLMKKPNKETYNDDGGGFRVDKNYQRKNGKSAPIRILKGFGLFVLVIYLYSFLEYRFDEKPYRDLLPYVFVIAIGACVIAKIIFNSRNKK